jgi:hypothetical protein
MFEMDKFDPKALESDITKLIEAQIGASVQVTLSKFERTNPGYTNDQVFVTLFVREDWSGLLTEHRFGVTPDDAQHHNGQQGADQGVARGRQTDNLRTTRSYTA